MMPQSKDVEIERALHECLIRRFGARYGIVEFHRSPCAYRTSFPIDDIYVRLSDGTAINVLFKNLDRNSLGRETRAIKPAFVYDPFREIEAYEDILSESDLGTPAFYGSVAEPNKDQYWLFVEKVPGIELYQVGELEIWQDAARWLARMHNKFETNCKAVQRTSHLLRYDAHFYRRWFNRAKQFTGGRLDWLTSGYDAVIEKLVTLPSGFIHGEFYPSNVLVCPSENRVCPVDWEMAGVGPFLIDVAALTAGKWTATERDSIALAYAGDLDADKSAYVPSELLFESLDYCQLYLCVQWLGWAPNWRPPENHAHDWLVKARVIAAKLALA